MSGYGSIPNIAESYATGISQGYGKRMSDIRLENERQAQMEAQRKDIAKAAGWVMQGANPQDQSARWEQALDFYQSQGEDVAPFRGRPHLAQMFAQMGHQGSALTSDVLGFQQMTKGMSTDDIEKARRIKLGLDPRAMTSSPKVIDVGGVKYLQNPLTDELTPLKLPTNEIVTAETTAGTEALIAEEKAAAAAKGKAKGEFETRDIVASTKASIASAQKSAESQAKGLGEDELAYRRLKSSLPSLGAVVSELRDLADIATATKVGRFFDSAAKEMGFGATEGATASAKYGALVRNQVLPLLKATLGAAFTDNERQALESTMGDQNLTAKEKQVQLDAFWNAKILELESKERLLGKKPEIDVRQPNRPKTINIDEMTEDELDAFLAE